MNIGIIGTGNMGGGLGKLWAGKGHKVFFGSRDPGKAKSLVDSVGQNAQVGTIADAARFGEVVLLATPWGAAQEAVKAAGSLNGKVVIDCTNPLTEDFSALAIGHTTSAAEEVARWAPGARVVKAFNHVYAQIIQSSPQFGSQNASVFFCGDDPKAKEVAGGLMSDIGFEPVDSGPLTNARYIEPLAGLMVQLAHFLGMGTDIAVKLIRR